MSRVLAAVGLAMVAVGLALVLAPANVPPRAVATATLSVTPSAAASAVASAGASATAPAAIPPGYRVQVPRLGIDLAILEGDVRRDTVEQQTPESYAFHLPGTAIPGRPGNAYLYAHARRGMFLTLWNVAVGDVIWISTPDGRALRYVVAEIHPAVPPDDVSWAAADGPDRLTLQTSTGPNAGDPRFVVVARPS